MFSTKLMDTAQNVSMDFTLCTLEIVLNKLFVKADNS